jgi:hypothetical protein
MPAVIIEEEFNPQEVFSPVDESPLFEDVKRKLSPQEAFVATAKIFAPMGIGVVLIVFGLTTTGSYFSPVGKFAGVLAEIFYGWQAGRTGYL